MEGYLSCPPHGGGAGGGFGLLGEQSLQQPPPSLRDTSASGGHIEGKAHFDKLSDHATTGPRVRGGHKRLSLSWMAFLFHVLLRRDYLFVPLMEGCRGGFGLLGSNPYNNHLRHFVTPPPAEDI